MSSSDEDDYSGKLEYNPLLHGGKRKSAFLPYKPTNTVLTNLQRGNTEANISNEICLSFHEKTGQGEITEEQVSSYIHIVNALDSKQLTPLHWACYYGQLQSVNILIKYGADVNKLAPDMISPLLLAAAGGHHEIVRKLLQYKVDVNHMDIIGNTALMYAAAGNHPHTCYELIQKSADVTLTNEDGDTAYIIALRNNANLAQTVIEN
uniref:Putative regulatory factor x-associated ankyrin-containing protein n=1 Tax=Corethrella appendiculata TaxID=1370023 RepID=U5ER16_9DIPT